jgi:three-Cys-motif partner protein
MDMNRNALWSNPAGADPADLDRMTSFWGDASWRDVAYTQQGNLFGGADLVKKAGNEEIVEAFRRRLVNVGFKEVPPPIPMRNSKNAVVYYLFFASQNKTGAKIAKHIFRRYESFHPPEAP